MEVAHQFNIFCTSCCFINMEQPYGSATLWKWHVSSTFSVLVVVKSKWSNPMEVAHQFNSFCTSCCYIKLGQRYESVMSKRKKKENVFLLLLVLFLCIHPLPPIAYNYHFARYCLSFFLFSFYVIAFVLAQSCHISVTHMCQLFELCFSVTRTVHTNIGESG